MLGRSMSSIEKGTRHIFGSWGPAVHYARLGHHIDFLNWKWAIIAIGESRFSLMSLRTTYLHSSSSEEEDTIYITDSLRIARLKVSVCFSFQASNRIWLSAKRSSSSLEIFRRIRCGDRPQVARAITLIESERETDKQLAQSLVSRCIEWNQEHQNEFQSIRLGITGPPGAGKSCFIEAFGEHIISKHNKKVSVLTIDPSSSRTGGSLLGDKTRMFHLSRNPAAYIRSSPSSGQLGGVCKTTSDSIELLQAAGYNVTIVETIGVGQSEFKIQDMSDCVILLIPPGGGDELQAVKKGIVEVCDIICVTKFDGHHLAEARRVGSEYMSATKYIRPKSKAWRPRVLMTSAREKIGLEKLWTTIEKFRAAIGSQMLIERRGEQRVANMWTYLQEDFLRNAKHYCRDVEDEVLRGNITPAQGSQKVMEAVCNFTAVSRFSHHEGSPTNERETQGITNISAES